MSEEKTEQPTDKKLEDARKKGQVPVSRDLARVLTLSVVMEIALNTEKLWHGAIDSLFELSFLRIGQPFQAAMTELVVDAGLLLLLVFGIFFIIYPVVAIFSFWGQFGILFSPESIIPKFDKLDPVNGAKQLFSKKKLGELLLSIFKAVLIGTITYILARDELPDIMQLAAGAPKDIYYGFIAIVRSIFHILIIVCCVLGIIDFAMHKHFHIKDLMMDMEEIKREYKETEGDPMVKGARKQLARQLAMEGPTERTANADAVVVNPTHFAVAMLYDPNIIGVPIVLAKGKDEVAHAMIKKAKQCNIPVIRHVWLARTLYATCKEETVVPKASYEAIAHVYAVVHELRANKQMDREVELEKFGHPPDNRLS